MRRRGSMAAGWILVVVVMVVVVHGSVCLASSTLDNGIFEWVRQKGGIYHEGQEFRRHDLHRDDGSTLTIAGVFATQDIPAGTVLAKIPWNAILSSDDLEESGQLCCGLVNRLKRELARPPHKDGGGRSTSFYAPYIDYVRQLPLTSIPSMWSALGKQLVVEMTGTTSSSREDVLPPEDPVKWLEEEWFPQCGGSWDDQLGVQAAVIVLTRSDDHILIPGKKQWSMAAPIFSVVVVVGVRTCFLCSHSLHSLPLLSQGTICTIIGMGIGRMPKRFPRRGFTISQRRPRIFERGTKFISATTNVTDATIDSMNMEPQVRILLLYCC
jgi:hypothetical protein